MSREGLPRPPRRTFAAAFRAILCGTKCARDSHPQDRQAPGGSPGTPSPTSPGRKPGDTGVLGETVLHWWRDVAERGVPRLPPGASIGSAKPSLQPPPSGGHGRPEVRPPGHPANPRRSPRWPKPAGARDGARCRADASLRACFGFHRLGEAEPSAAATRRPRSPGGATARPSGEPSAFAAMAQACGGQGWPRRRANQFRLKSGGKVRVATAAGRLVMASSRSCVRRKTSHSARSRILTSRSRSIV